jgi:hypothetical protein
MKRREYLANAAVASFVRWAADFVAAWPKEHSVKRSKNSDAFRFQIGGIDRAYTLYAWRSSWQDPANGKTIVSADAASTERVLATLTRGLLTTLEHGDSAQHCEYAQAVLSWGGVRGSADYYKRLDQAGKLIEYHRALHLGSQAALDPDLADDGRLDAIAAMSSGITKVHCLLSRGRLPIYDTRFAAALTTLVARWCEEQGLARVPDLLLFGCGPAKGGQQRTPSSPTGQTYPAMAPNAPARWMRWQLRSCWLLEALLSANGRLFAGLPMAERVNRFAMGCFMIGYDLSPAPGKPKAAAAKRTSRLLGGVGRWLSGHRPAAAWPGA